MPSKVLVIDDEIGIGNIVELTARQLGMECRAVHDPLEALSEFLDYAPDVVMLDMIMPSKDGIDVLVEIVAAGVPTRIVLTSGYGDAYLRLGIGVARFHEFDGISVLRKPFRRAALMDALTGAPAPIADRQDANAGAGDVLTF